MKDIIIGISGKRGSGKTSLCNMIHAAVMANITDEEGTHLVDMAQIDSGNGELLIAPVDNEQGWGVLKLDDPNPIVQEWLNINVHPFVRKIALATPIKQICVDLLELQHDDIFGVGQDKQKSTPFKWGDTLITRLKDKGVTKEDYLTHRDLLEYIGNIFTTLKTDTFINYGLKAAKLYGGGISVFEDIRRKCELQKIKEAGGIVIRLLRNPEDANTTIEKELDDVDKSEFDLVIDNTNMDIPECHQEVLKFLVEKGIFSEAT